ncbi:MAG: C39 family peptidase [Patescibacteria group bacterium]
MFIPFFKQENEDYCAPAVLQMIFNYFNITISQDELAKIANTPRVGSFGTLNKDLVHTAMKYGLHCYAKENATIEEIQFFLHKNIPIVVSYINPDGEEGHFAIITDISSDIITMNDPWNGKDTEISVENFLPRWRNGFEPGERWMMAVSNKKF